MPFPQAPGNYPGPGQASLINAGHQYYAWNNQAVPASTASVAFLLERQKSSSYPFGAGFEVAFSGAPGAFEIDIQGAETDQDANFVKLGAITSVNASNVGRYDLPPSQFPKFVRLFVSSLTNAVNITAVVTR